MFPILNTDSQFKEVFMTTIKDIARITGLSVGTISNYNSKRNINQSNKELIEKAISDLNYTPNSVGRYLRVGKTKTVGIITNTISTSFISQAYSTLETALLDNGYDVIFCNSQGDLNVEQNKLDFLSGRSVDCIVLFPISCLYTNISSINTPIIVADNFLETTSCPSIIFDDEISSYNATEFLIKNGHVRIACITGYDDHHTTIMRKKGYLEALKHYKIKYDPSIVINANFNNSQSEEATTKLLQSNFPPTAFLITSNEMLLGFLLSTKNSNVKIPDDISYITFDNADYYSILDSRPTYVYQSKELLGKMLFDTIIELLKNKEIKKKNMIKYVKTELIIGDSVKKIN